MPGRFMVIASSERTAPAGMSRAATRLFRAMALVLASLAAGVLRPSPNAASTVPMIGASGAISGVLGAYLLLYPRARVLTLIAFGLYIRTVEVPAMFVLGFWFVLQFLNAFLSAGTGGGVAWYAHIGGFLAGILLIGIFKRRDVALWSRRRDD